MSFDNDNTKPMSLRRWRLRLIVSFVPVLLLSVLWHICHEPRIVWDEWIDLYRKGPPQ